MKNTKNTKKYYLGLDIGTDSVGYAVTTEEYDLMKFKGEPMWGVHLFDEAKLKNERRSFRSARRRLDRRQQRVKLVQDIFAAEIVKVDKDFYLRIEKSALCRDEVPYAHTLFCDPDYTDVEYYKQYPTIHHLLRELIYDPAPHDVRLVYLACAWLVAHRGHFFSDVSKENVQELQDIDKAYQELMDLFGESHPWEADPKAFGDILKKKIGVNAKYKELCTYLFGSPKAPKTVIVLDGAEYSVDAMVQLLCGKKTEAKKLFCNEEYDEVPSFALDCGEDDLSAILAMLGDDAELILILKKLFDWSVLADILGNMTYVSENKCLMYEEHKEDLALLKRLVARYKPDKYKECFRDESKGGYAAYISVGKHKQEDLCKYVKALFKDVSPNEEDAAALDDILQKCERIALCPKQINSDNRVIPYQIYWVELKKILENASAYLPFLNEADADGYVAKDKLLSIMEFRVPYFVGPMKGKFAWLTKKAEGKIYPWNFENMVDFEASEQAFIDRMTNTCTYLPYAKVLPKCSLLHEKFQVLNEINTLSVNGHRIDSKTKQRLYLELFMTRRRITKKAVRDFLLCNGLYTKEELETLSGIDDTVKSSLSSHCIFKSLMDRKQLTLDDAEEIIKRATYTEDKKRFAEWMDQNYPTLSEEDRRYISRQKFKDFARLSKELLCDIFETEPNKETGAVISIIDRMWNENLNLMEILSDRFTYRAQIESKAKEYYSENPRSIDDRMEQMGISNAVKRPILRTLDIVSDVVKAQRGAPKKIFVEMARGGKTEDKGKRTRSRYQQLKELYSKCRLEDVREMEAQLDAMGADKDRRLDSEKLFLYFLQLGKSMYSGTHIDIERIGDKLYDVDHIYPQSKVKDDSVLNNKVLVLSKENGAKSDRYPIDDGIRRKMSGWWKLLLDNGFITLEKYKRLTRHTPFDANEEWGFINRQLVETRQSTKAVAALLKEKYPETDIVYVKAGMVSEFRQEFDMLKSRSVNDLHHAKDAYLNIVVGNVYNEKFTKKWFDSHRDDYNLKVKTLFSHEVKLYTGKIVWCGDVSLAKVKNIVHNKNAVHLTRYAFLRQGGLFDQMPVKAAEGLAPLKKGMPTEKYGGYNGPTTSFYMLTRYTVGKKAEVMMLPVDLLYASKFFEDAAYAPEYAKDTIKKITGKNVDTVEFPLGLRKIKINTILELDGMRMSVAGKSKKGRAIIPSLTVPLIVKYRWERYIKRLERLVENKKEKPAMQYDAKHDEVTVEQNVELYDLLVAKLSNKPYCKRPANPVETLRKGRDRFVNADVFAQATCLLQIISVFGRVSGGCDLQLVGGAANAAAMSSFSSAISNWKKNYTDVRIIDQSASGLFETRSENLLDLL